MLPFGGALSHSVAQIGLGVRILCRRVKSLRVPAFLNQPLRIYHRNDDFPRCRLISRNLVERLADLVWSATPTPGGIVSDSLKAEVNACRDYFEAKEADPGLGNLELVAYSV
jgi:hypothetical protein